MAEERRYSVGRGVMGCLAAWAMMIGGGAILLLLATLFKQDYKTWENVGVVIIWPIGVCIGAHYACMKGKTTGSSNAVVVGVLAELVALGAVEQGNQGLGPAGGIAAAIQHPGGHWSQLIVAVITIPAALLGGYIWVNGSGKNLPNNDQPL